MFEIDYQTMESLLSYKLCNKFGLISRIFEYKNSPNSSLSVENHHLSLFRFDEQKEDFEDYRLTPFWGISSLQYHQDNKRTIINLRAFPDGSANWDRNCILIIQRINNTYQVTIIIGTNEELTNIEHIKTWEIPKITLDSIRQCLKSIKEEIDQKSFSLFLEHLEALGPIIYRTFETPVLDFQNPTV